MEDPEIRNQLDEILRMMKDLAATLDNTLELLSRLHEKELDEDDAVQGLFNRAQDTISRVQRELNEDD